MVMMMVDGDDSCRRKGKMMIMLMLPVHMKVRERCEDLYIK